MVLSEVNEAEGSYSNVPTIWRLVRNLHDSTGSRTLLESVTCLSHKMSKTHKIPDTTSKVMTYADLHGNSLSASSKAAVNLSTAKRIKTVPGTSMRPDVIFPMKPLLLVVIRRLICPWFGKSFGIARTVIMKAGAATEHCHGRNQSDVEHQDDWI